MTADHNHFASKDEEQDIGNSSSVPIQQADEADVAKGVLELADKEEYVDEL